MMMTMHDCGFWDCVTGDGVSDYLHLVKTKKRDRTQKPNYSPPGQIAWGDQRVSLMHKVVNSSVISKDWVLKPKKDIELRNQSTIQ